jgi:hypothetical protein
VTRSTGATHPTTATHSMDATSSTTTATRRRRSPSRSRRRDSPAGTRRRAPPERRDRPQDLESFPDRTRRRDAGVDRRRQLAALVVDRGVDSGDGRHHGLVEGPHSWSRRTAATVPPASALPFSARLASRCGGTRCISSSRRTRARRLSVLVAVRSDALSGLHASWTAWSSFAGTPVDSSGWSDGPTTHARLAAPPGRPR